MAIRRYIWDSVNDCVIAEEDEFGNTLVTYTREPGSHGRLISESRNGQTRQYHFDALGNTRALTDDVQNVTDTFSYDAFGNVVDRTGTNPTPYQWVGEHGYESDQNNQPISVRRRQYQPGTGRWTSRDLLEGLTWAEAFIFAMNAPTYQVDPTGKVLVIPVNQNLRGLKCGDEAFVEWNFVLDRDNPCNGPGFFVQEVRVTCTIHACDSPAPEPQVFTYYEAWPVPKGKERSSVRKGASTDRADGRSRNNMIGTYRQEGTIRFFCDKDGKLLTGWTPPPKKGQKGAQYGQCQCETSPGTLASTSQKPEWWKNEVADDLQGKRWFSLDWTCCPCIPETVDADASPRKQIG